MSDEMMLDIAKMSYELAMQDELSRHQFYVNTQRLVAALHAARAEAEAWKSLASMQASLQDELTARLSTTMSLRAEIKALQKEVERLRADHLAITHCDNCGCSWLDDGLNPVGCPYCKQSADAKILVAERDALEAENERLRADAEAEALAKHQPCGCVTCTCEDEKQCQGCGAQYCGNHADHPAYVKQQLAAMDGTTFDASFLRHIASVCRAAYDLCQPKPQRTPEDDREYNGGLCLSELANIADEIEQRLAASNARQTTGITAAQQPADDEVVLIDGVGAARSSVKSCRDGVQWIRVGDRVYWPLSDSDAKRLHSACCGNGSFDGPTTPADEALLRQALEALERGAWDTLSGRNAAAAIRKRLEGGKT